MKIGLQLLGVLLASGCAFDQIAGSLIQLRPGVQLCPSLGHQRIALGFQRDNGRDCREILPHRGIDIRRCQLLPA